MAWTLHRSALYTVIYTSLHTALCFRSIVALYSFSPKLCSVKYTVHCTDHCTVLYVALSHVLRPHSLVLAWCVGCSEIVCTAHCIVYNYIVYTYIVNTYIVYTYIVYTLRCIGYNVHFTLHSVWCRVHDMLGPQKTPPCFHCRVYHLQLTIPAFLADPVKARGCATNTSVISRPGQSQGLLYKHLCHWFTD